MVDAAADAPERSFVASENEVVIVVSSLSARTRSTPGSCWARAPQPGLILHAREAYAEAKPVESTAALRALPVKHCRSVGGE